jgi:hypothetical protein
MTTPHTIDAYITFSFKGENHAPGMSIDLGALLAKADTLPDFHALIAKHNGIDTYSYLYEAMESHEIEFQNPRGLAQACFADGRFDTQQFERLWTEQQELTVIKEIARRHLGLEDLGEKPKLKEALLAAYKAGLEK